MMRINKIYARFFPVFLLCVFLTSCAGPSKKVPPKKSFVPTVPVAEIVPRQGLYHTVAPGETLWRIAKMYEVDQGTITKVNRISNVRDIEIGTRLYIPDAAPRRHVITLYPSSKWKYIIVHHSATEMGNAEIFNSAHKQRGWQEVGYHFIIDNNTAGKDDGQIETGPRWTKQADGAHCKASSMNEKGIGICLVGNFSEGIPTRSQMNSLVHLVNILRKYYKIPKSRILGHRDVAGAKTECPGTRFPWKEFMSRLGN
jgi:N-acetylmuramoyl-L-alanine amidase